MLPEEDHVRSIWLELTANAERFVGASGEVVSAVREIFVVSMVAIVFPPLTATAVSNNESGVTAMLTVPPLILTLVPSRTLSKPMLFAVKGVVMGSKLSTVTPAGSSVLTAFRRSFITSFTTAFMMFISDSVGTGIVALEP